MPSEALLTTIVDRRPNVSAPDFITPATVHVDRDPDSGRNGETDVDLDGKVYHLQMPTLRAASLKAAPHARFNPLQTWEGFVEDVRPDDGVFTARLCDLTDEKFPHEEFAELFLDDVDDDDLELVRRGGVFRWIIGYREQIHGRRERVSSIVFRRLPAWTNNDIARAEVEGEFLSNAFQWD